jgi:uncharacterized protein Yka (UPF0111/DUF47 family)
MLVIAVHRMRTASAEMNKHDEDAAEVAKQAGKPEHQLDHHRRQQEADTPSGAIPRHRSH